MIASNGRIPVVVTQERNDEDVTESYGNDMVESGFIKREDCCLDVEKRNIGIRKLKNMWKLSHRFCKYV